MIRVRVAVAAGLLFGTPAGALAQPRNDDVAISHVDVRLEDRTAQVAFQVEGLEDDLRVERLRSGLDIRVVHKVEILGRRVAGLFPRRRLAHAELEHRLRYDPLTRTYILERQVDLGPGVGEHEDNDAGAQKPWSSPSLAEALRELTHPPAVTLRLPELPSAASLRLRIRSVFGRRWVMGIVPVRRVVSVEMPLEPDS